MAIPADTPTTTTNYAFRVPGRQSVPDVPLDLGNLATDVDTKLKVIDSREITASDQLNDKINALITRVTALETYDAYTKYTSPLNDADPSWVITTQYAIKYKLTNVVVLHAAIRRSGGTIPNGQYSFYLATWSAGAPTPATYVGVVANTGQGFMTLSVDATGVRGEWVTGGLDDERSIGFSVCYFDSAPATP